MKRLAQICNNKIRPRAKRIAIGLVIFFVVFTLAGFFALPPILKSVLVKELSGNLHRGVTIDRIAFNPYTLSVTARGLAIKERAGTGTFLRCEEIYLNLQSQSVLRMALVLKEVRLVKPYISIVRNRDLSYNFSDLLKSTEPRPPKKPLRFSLNNISIENGSIDFSDEPVQAKHTVRDLKIGVPFLSNIPSYVERFVEPHFSARIDDALFAIQGKTKPFAGSLESAINIDIKDIDLPRYLAYLPVKTDFKLLSAYLDLGIRVSFVESRKKTPSLTVSGNVALRKTAVNDGGNNPFFRLPLLDVSIAPSEPLLQKIHLSKIAIQSPELDTRRDKQGVINAQAIFPEKSSKEITVSNKAEGASTLSLDIDEIRLAAGKVSFSDLSSSKPFKTILNSINLNVDHFSNGKGKKSAYALSLESEVKESIRAQGQFSIDPLVSEGTVEAASVPLNKYSPFYENSVLFTIADGRLDFSTRYRYAKGQQEPEIALSAMSVSLGGLRLNMAGEKGDFVKIPALSVKETDLDLTKKVLTIGAFSTQKGEFLVKRLANGDLNLLNLTPQGPAPKDALQEKAAAKSMEPEKPWLVSLKQILIDGYTVRVEDQTTTAPVKLTARNLRVRGENLSTANNNRGKIAASLLLNRRGNVSASGTVGIEPLFADLKVDVKGIEIVPLQPYFTDKVRMTVTGGAVSTTGTFSMGRGKNGRMRTAYKGEASLTNFSSIDKTSGQDLLKLESLALSNMGLRFTPLSVNIKGVSLTNFYTLVSVSPEGNINLQKMLSADEPSPQAPAPAATPLQTAAASPDGKEAASKDIRVEQVTLQGGKIDFSDKSVKPEFSMHLSEIGGRVSGLSAEPNTTADVELRAKLDDYAPLEITGKMNPLRDDLFVDLKARIKDLDMSPATPYSGKYAGYTIEKGKLSVDVNYLIENRKLDSQNSIFIDQLNFGEEVESPQATHLPVKLAIALLKDRNGEIKLELPVAGSLDDPKFSVWRIVLRMVLNLLAKAATSPFALLGAAFGGGEELSYVEFDYGKTIITEPASRKLATVSKALQDRPSLKIDIEGHADMEKDRDGLKQLLFERKIKLQRLNELARKRLPAVPVDEVNIEPAEYGKYLKMAYKAEKFPKPMNFIGMAKDLPVPEMEKLMLTHTEITEGDLRNLASQRAMKVKDTILKSGQIDPERVFIVEAKSLSPESKEKIRESRVDFKLK